MTGHGNARGRPSGCRAIPRPSGCGPRNGGLLRRGCPGPAERRPWRQRGAACRAIEIAEQLEAELDIPKPVRIHWTGCPNSCGQAQVADIGLMGGPAKLDGKAVEGVRIFTGGKIGEGAVLAEQIEKGVPAAADVLVPRLKEIMIEEYGCTAKA